jgi:hypothetical protein
MRPDQSERGQISEDQIRGQIRGDQSGGQTRGELRTGQISEDQIRGQIRVDPAELRAEETSSAKNQKTKRERRRTSQAASHGKRYFRLNVIAIVNVLSNKQLRLIRNPSISCHGTPDRWQYDYNECKLLYTQLR